MVPPICLGAFLEQKLKGIPSIWNENATPDQLGPQLLILGTIVITAACALHARYPNLKERGLGEQWSLAVTALNLIPDMERRRRLVDLVLEVYALIPSLVFKSTLVPLVQSARLVEHHKNGNGAADDLLQSLTLHLTYKRDLPRVANIVAHLSEKVYVAAFENQKMRLSKMCVDCLAEFLHDVAIEKLSLRLPNKNAQTVAAAGNDDKAVVSDGLLDLLQTTMRNSARARAKATARGKAESDRSPMLSEKTKKTITSALNLLGLDDAGTRELVSTVFRELTAQLPRNMASSEEQGQWERFSVLTDEVMTLCDERLKRASPREAEYVVPDGIENSVQRLSRLPDFADALGEALAEALQQSGEDVDAQAIMKPLCDTLTVYAQSQPGKRAAVLGEAIALMTNRAVECLKRDHQGTSKMKQVVNLAYKLCDEIFLSAPDCSLPGTCPTEAKMAHRMTSNILRKLFMDRHSSSCNVSCGPRESYAESGTTHSHATTVPDPASHHRFPRTNTYSRSATSSAATTPSPRDVVLSSLRMTADLVPPRDAVISSLVNTDEAQRCMVILSGLGQLVPLIVFRRLSAEVFVQLGALPHYILVSPGNSVPTAEDHAIASWVAQNAECEFTLKAAAARVIRLAAKQVQERTKITDAIRLAIGDEKKTSVDATCVPGTEKTMTMRGGGVAIREEEGDGGRVSKDTGCGRASSVDHSAVSRLEMLARRPLHMALVNPLEPCRVSKWAVANVPSVVREVVKSTGQIDAFMEALSYKIAREQDVPRSVVFALDSLVDIIYDSMQQDGTPSTATEQRRLTKQKVRAIFKQRSTEIRELEVDRVARWLASQIHNAGQWRTPTFEKEIETVVATSVSTSLARAMADTAVEYADGSEELLSILHNEIMLLLTGYRMTNPGAQRLLDRVVAEVPSSTLATNFLLKLARRVAQFVEEEERRRATKDTLDLAFPLTEKENVASVEDFLTTLTERVLRQFTSVTRCTFTQLTQELERLLGHKPLSCAEPLKTSQSSRLGEADSSPHEAPRGVLNNLIAYAKRSRIGTDVSSSHPRASSSFLSVSPSLPHTLDGRIAANRRGQCRVDSSDNDMSTINRACSTAPEFSEDVHEQCARLGGSLAEKILLWMKVRNTPYVTQTASLVTAALRAARTSVEGIRAMIHLISHTAVKNIVNGVRRDHHINGDVGTTSCGGGLKQSEAAYVEQVLTLIADDVFLMLINERDFSTEDTERLQRAFLDLKPLIKRTLYSDNMEFSSAYPDVPISGRRSESCAVPTVRPSSPRTHDPSPIQRDEQRHRTSVTLSASDKENRVINDRPHTTQPSSNTSPVVRHARPPADKALSGTSSADASGVSGAKVRKNKGARRKNFNIDSLLDKNDGDVVVNTDSLVASVDAVREPAKRVNKARALMRDLTESVFKGTGTPDVESTKRATQYFEKLNDVVFDEALKTDTNDPVHKLNCQLARTNARNSWVRQMTTNLPGKPVSGNDTGDDDEGGLVIPPRMHTSESIIIGEWMVDIWKQAMTESTNLTKGKKMNKEKKITPEYCASTGEQQKDSNNQHTHLDLTSSSPSSPNAKGREDGKVKLMEAEVALVNIASEKAIEVAVRRTGIKNPNLRDVRSTMVEVMEVVKGSFMGSLATADPEARQRATRFLSSLEEEAISGVEKQADDEAWLPISSHHRSVFRNLIEEGGREGGGKEDPLLAMRTDNGSANISPRFSQSPRRLRGYNSLGEWYADEPLSPELLSDLDSRAPVLRLTREPHSMEYLPPRAKMEDIDDEGGEIPRHTQQRAPTRKLTLHADYDDENHSDLRQCALSAALSAACGLPPQQMDARNTILPDHTLPLSRQQCHSRNNRTDIKSNAIACVRDNIDRRFEQRISAHEVLDGSLCLSTFAYDPFRVPAVRNASSSPSPSRSRVSSADSPSPRNAFRHPVRSNPVASTEDNAVAVRVPTLDGGTNNGLKEPHHFGDEGSMLSPPRRQLTPNQQQVPVPKQLGEQQRQFVGQHQASLLPKSASSSAGIATITPAPTSKAELQRGASKSEETQQVDHFGRLFAEEVIRRVSTFRRGDDVVSTELAELVLRAMGHTEPHLWPGVKRAVDRTLLTCGPGAVRLWEKVKDSVDHKHENTRHIATVIPVTMPPRTRVVFDPACDEPIVAVPVGNLCAGDEVMFVNDVMVVDRVQAAHALAQAVGEIRIQVSRTHEVLEISSMQPSEVRMLELQDPTGNKDAPASRLPLAPSQLKSPARSRVSPRMASPFAITASPCAEMTLNIPRAGILLNSPRSENVLLSQREKGNPVDSPSRRKLSPQPCRFFTNSITSNNSLLPLEEKREKSVSFSHRESLICVDEKNVFPGPGTYLLFHNETRNFELHWCDRRPPVDAAYTLLGFFSATKNAPPSSNTLDNAMVICRRDRTDRKNVFKAWASFIQHAATHAASQVLLLELDGPAQCEFATKLAFKERKTQQIRLLRAGEESTLNFVDANDRVPSAVVALHPAHLIFDGVYSLDTTYFIEEGKDYGAVVEF